MCIVIGVRFHRDIVRPITPICSQGLTPNKVMKMSRLTNVFHAARKVSNCREKASVKLTSPFNMRMLYDDKLTFSMIESTSQVVGKERGLIPYTILSI